LILGNFDLHQSGPHARSELSFDFQTITLLPRGVPLRCTFTDDAQQSGLYAMQRFARTVRRDLDAVTNALTKGWSNGQTEGHINRLKTLKRAMYGRAGAELLRARMLPLHSPIQHGK
jgi:Transposase